MGRLDFLNEPTAGAFTMTLNATTYTFNVGAAPATSPPTVGAPSSTNYYIDPATFANAGTFTTALANDVQAAYETAYEGQTVGNATFGGADDAVRINGTLINLSGAATATAAADLINGQESTTGVYSIPNAAGDIVLYSPTKQTFTVGGWEISPTGRPPTRASPP